MLVLTRRTDQKIVFPNLGVTLQVLRIRGNVVKVGIDAPADVTVLRHEIAEEGAAEAPPRTADRIQEFLRATRHALNNRLNSVTVALHLYRKQLDNGMVDDAESTFQKIVDQFASLDREFATSEKILAPAQGQPALAPRNGRATSRQALLVEDDRNECELLAGFLRLHDFKVVTAGDGADALQYLSKNSRPDVVLLDMLMPRCDGAKTVELIRRNPEYKGLKVYAISGTEPGELGVATGPLGIDRWFPKPLNPETLVQELNRALAPAGAV